MSFKVDAGAAYAQGLSQRVKSYIDTMLGPFLRTRVQIFVAKAGKIDKKKGTIKVSIKGKEYTALLGNNTAPNTKKYPHVRILYDSRTRIMYYDDVVPERYVTDVSLS